MKKFRHVNGYPAGETMTVKELISKLNKYDSDTPVIATWEGVFAYINNENFELEIVSKGYSEDECICLTIDVESH